MTEVLVAAACVGVVTIPNVANIHAALGAYDLRGVLLLLGSLLLGIALILAANDGLPSVWTSALLACTAIVGVVAYVAAVQLLFSYGSYNMGRLLLVALLMGAAGISVAVPDVRQRWLEVFSSVPAVARYVLAGVLGIGVCSAFLSASPIHAFAEIVQYVLLFLFAGLIAAQVLISHETVRNVILAGIVATVALYLLSFFASWGYYLAGGRVLVWPDVNLGFSNIRHFNQLQTWTLPLLVLPALMLPKKYRLMRWGCVAVTAVWWALLISSGGRGTALGFIIGSVVVAMLFGRKAWPWLRLQGVAMVGGATIFGLLYRPLVQASLLDRNPISGGNRFDHWGHAWDLAVSSPLLGVGPMHYAQLSSDSVGGHPHNVLLQFAAEWGLLVTIILALLAVWAFSRWLKQSRVQIQTRDKMSRGALIIGLTATIITGAAHSMVSGITVTPVSQLVMVLILGWAWGLYLKASADKRQEPINRIHHLSLIAAATISVAVLLFFVIGEVPHLQESAAAYSELGHDTKFHPRFWQQGFINILK